MNSTSPNNVQQTKPGLNFERKQIKMVRGVGFEPTDP